MFKRIVAVSGLIGVLGALAFAIPAHADVKADCVISGEVKARDKVDPALGVRLIGGKGYFNFAQRNLICVGTAKGEPLVGPNVNVTGSNGWFQNTICGTGKVVGTVSATGDPRVTAAMRGKKFAIEFVDFSGVFYWHNWDKPDLNDKLQAEDPGGPATGVKQTGPKPYSSAGVFQWGPPLSKPAAVLNEPPGNCVKAFNVEGTFEMHFSS